jgi:hypothetical protein
MSAWFDDLPSLYAFEREARRELGGLERRVRPSPRRLVYELSLDVPGYAEVRAVRVEFLAGPVPVPHVYADGPGESAHRYADDALCMYHPHDPADRRWVPEDGLASLIDYFRTHLFQEAEARNGQSWPGDEAPHGPVPRRRRG